MKKFITFIGLILMIIFSSQNLSANEIFVDSTKNSYLSQKSKLQTKRLRYMFVSNVSLIGFFSNGSVAYYLRCELTRKNFNWLSKNKPYAKYTI